jgi:hypothetical protein
MSAVVGGVSLLGVGAGALTTAAIGGMLGGGSSAQAGAAAADPFASQRPQYQQQLQQMMQPGGFTPQDPSYQFRFDQGMNAVNAGSAASGMLNSGNRMLALENYGQGQASTEYANQFSRLSQLAGGNIGSPAAAGQIIQSQSALNQQGASAIGNAVGQAVKGWGSSLSPQPAQQPFTTAPQTDVNMPAYDSTSANYTVTG